MEYVDMVFSSSLDIILKKLSSLSVGPSLTASKDVRSVFIGFVKKTCGIEKKQKERRLNPKFLRKECPLKNKKKHVKIKE